MSKAPHHTDSDDAPRRKKRGAGVLVWVLLAMLIAGLGGFGVENFGGGASSVGQVGDTEITANDYAREVRNQVNALSRQFGTPISMADARAMGIDRQALAGLVNRAALDNEAARIGLSVGDAVVAAELGKIAAFRGLDGSFDRAAYGQTLKQNNTNEADFEATIRRDVARSLLTGAVAGGVLAPATLTDTVFGWAGEKRGLTLLVLDEAALDAPLPAPTEAEVKAHYDANIASYTRPEAKRLQYAALLPETLGATLEVPEDQVKAAYQARLDEFVIAEKRLVERLVFSDEAAAAEAKARLDQGTPFEDLVKERGLTLDDIDMGDVTRAELAEAGEAVFALQGPGVVGPLPSALGPALYRMNAVLAAQETTYDAARPELLKALQTEAAAKAIADKVEAIDDLLAGGATLEELAKEFGMELGTTDYAAGATDNDAITGYAAFRKAADAVKEGDFAEAVLMDDGGLVALQMLETVPPAPVALDKITERVTAETRAAALAKALSAKAASLKAAVDGGAGLETQGAVTSVEPKDRQAVLDNAPPAVLEAAFAMAQGEVRLIEDGGYVALVRLDSIAPADATSEDGEALRAAIVENVERDIATDISTLFTGAVSQAAGISLDQQMIDAVNTQMGN
ncbi:peptidylprolyl isomerase [Tabrizicola oligotrophica]|uniref:Peptidylprolyl isomerase n=1 Tax=Tabrizicola oligotrophica TaxID=2710650 RepID=A0A6M0QUW2_9RHOB|nr:peptidylprolyl isomerase [Tabrizicola oligotrophica]NEY91276.1 peptidylprolyl isomerase [Tabrizicola oligotrophica]